jgi:hypothetical protein
MLGLLKAYDLVTHPYYACSSILAHVLKIYNEYFILRLMITCMIFSVYAITYSVYVVQSDDKRSRKLTQNDVIMQCKGIQYMYMCTYKCVCV